MINKWKEVAECHIHDASSCFLAGLQVFLGPPSAKGRPEESEAYFGKCEIHQELIDMLAVKRAPRSSE